MIDDALKVAENWRTLMASNLAGWIVVDKPSGMSSAAVVSVCRRILARFLGCSARSLSVGHTGTLDPMATGVLVLAVGQATKLASWVVEKQKSYRGTVRFGASTDSDDADGLVVASTDAVPGRELAELALRAFAGGYDQVPPSVSAIHVDGRRAYARVRDGEALVLPARSVRIDRLDWVSWDSARAEGVLEVDCGPGTYIRSLARDLGVATGSLAYLVGLRRLRVGKFLETMSISLDIFENMVYNAPQSSWILPLSYPLDDIPVVELSAIQVVHLLHGRAIGSVPSMDGVVCRCEYGGSLVALARDDRAGWLHPFRVFKP